ncbi:MAG: DUF2235 domain-containing protein [Jatrophihabitans sp.]
MTSHASPSNLTPHAKRLILCLDGTNDEIGRGLPTNVGKTYEMLAASDVRQATYYDPGIGTLPAANARGYVDRKVSVGLELMLGRGIRTKLAAAYTWLMENYDHGDPATGRPRAQVYVFGFSRGAFAARALVGMLNRVGLLRPGAENLVPYAVAHYTVNQRRFTAARLAETVEFANAFCWGTEQDPLSAPWPGVANDQNRHSVPIEFLGLWDTVEAVGLPGRTVDWEGTHTLRNVRRVRHAVSIDEWRRPFHEFLTTHPNLNPLSDDGTPNATADVQETWFPGVHCDVGGTYPDSQLSTTAFRWVLDSVVEEFIPREQNSFQLACQARTSPAATTLHTDAAIWSLAVPRKRPIKPTYWIHDSVRTLLADTTSGYHPRNLPADPVWLTAP